MFFIQLKDVFLAWYQSSPEHRHVITKLLILHLCGIFLVVNSVFKLNVAVSGHSCPLLPCNLQPQTVVACDWQRIGNDWGIIVFLKHLLPFCASKTVWVLPPQGGGVACVHMASFRAVWLCRHHCPCGASAIGVGGLTIKIKKCQLCVLQVNTFQSIDTTFPITHQMLTHSFVLVLWAVTSVICNFWCVIMSLCSEWNLNNKVVAEWSKEVKKIWQISRSQSY